MLFRANLRYNVRSGNSTRSHASKFHFASIRTIEGTMYLRALVLVLCMQPYDCDALTATSILDAEMNNK